jgi:DNA polymerase I-like protein with 3'-5' exonuclease and polymerase domains
MFIIVKKIQPMIKDEMENAFKLEVPLVVDLGMGKIGKRIRIKHP